MVRLIKMFSVMLIILLVSSCVTYQQKPFIAHFYGITDNIHIAGEFNKTYIKVLIKNKSNRPIDCNYFADEWGFVTDGGSLYKLNSNIRYYPGVINPGHTGVIHLHLDDRDNGMISYIPKNIKYMMAIINFGKIKVQVNRTTLPLK